MLKQSFEDFEVYAQHPLQLVVTCVIIVVEVSCEFYLL